MCPMIKYPCLIIKGLGPTNVKVCSVMYHIKILKPISLSLIINTHV